MAKPSIAIVPDWQKETSGFFMLAAPFSHRDPLVKRLSYSKNSYYPDHLSMVVMMNTALEQDVARGRFDKERPLVTNGESVLETLMTRMEPPCSMPLSDPASIFAWPTPGAPWAEPEYCDPRERLLARLIHLGIDPWEMCVHKELFPANLVQVAMLCGYHGVVKQAFELHGARSYDIDAVTKGVVPMSMLQMAAEQGSLEMARFFLDKEASLMGVLVNANTPEMASLIVQAGASLSDACGSSTVAETWVKIRPSQQARAMIEACKASASPDDLLLSASTGANWAPLADALVGCPDWKTKKFPLGGALLPLPLLMLFGATARNTGVIRNALRLLDASPLGEVEVSPGLSEKSLFRLLMGKLSCEKINLPTKVEVASQQKVLDALAYHAVSQEEGVNDARSFARAAHHFTGVTGSSGIAQYIISASRLFSDYVTIIPGGRSLTDFHDIAALARLICCESGRVENINEVWAKIFSDSLPNAPDLFRYTGAASSIWRSTAPCDQSGLLSDLAWNAALVSKANVDGLKRMPSLCATLVTYLKDGAVPAWTMEEARLFDEVSKGSFTRFSSGKDMEALRLVSSEIYARLDASFLDKATAAAPRKTASPGIRL